MNGDHEHLMVFSVRGMITCSLFGELVNSLIALEHWEMADILHCIDYGVRTLAAILVKAD